MKIFFEELAVETTQNNLVQWDPRLAEFVDPHEYFYLVDLTERFQKLVDQSQMQNGIFTAQALHTTCVLSMNEFNEPMLLKDISRQLEQMVPRLNNYLHNSKLRTANLCEDDHKCDRNADAHIKSFIIGCPTIQILIANRQLVLGRWQRIALIDFDGPRTRKMAIQILGE